MEKPLTVSRDALLENGSDQSFREFLHDFMVFSRRLEGVRDFLARQIGVTAPQYEILSHLRQSISNRGLAVSEVAARLHCTGSFATTELGKLKGKGLIRKARDPLDARRVQVTTTAVCERHFRDVAPIQRRLNDTLFNSLTGREFAVLHKVFGALTGDGDRAVALAAAVDALGASNAVVG